MERTNKIFPPISNSTWTEWSTIKGVIGQVISIFDLKLRARLLRELYETKINRNYKKIREEYDSGIN